MLQSSSLTPIELLKVRRQATHGIVQFFKMERVPCPPPEGDINSEARAYSSAKGENRQIIAANSARKVPAAQRIERQRE
jgi:hypothetical protein